MGGTGNPSALILSVGVAISKYTAAILTENEHWRGERGQLATMPEVGATVAHSAGIRQTPCAVVLASGATGRSSSSSGGDASKRGDLLSRERTTEQSAAAATAVSNDLLLLVETPSLAYPSSAIVVIWWVLAAVLRCLLWLSFPWLEVPCASVQAGERESPCTTNSSRDVILRARSRGGGVSPISPPRSEEFDARPPTAIKSRAPQPITDEHEECGAI